MLKIGRSVTHSGTKASKDKDKDTTKNSLRKTKNKEASSSSPELLSKAAEEPSSSGFLSRLFTANGRSKTVSGKKDLQPMVEPKDELRVSKNSFHGGECTRRRITSKFALPEWLVIITVKKATNIAAQENGTSNTYVKVDVLGHEGRTNVQKGLNPEWNESFDFLLPDTPHNDTYALFRCYHSDAKSKDIFSGYFRLEVSSILEVLRSRQDKQMEITRAYPLLSTKETDKVSGDLILTVLIQQYLTEDPEHPLEFLTTNPQEDKPKKVAIYTSSTSALNNADIIFIHGFTGTWNETWAVNDKLHILWPNSWLKRDMPGSPRTIFVKYKKNAVGNIASYLQDISADVLDQLSQVPDLGKDRPIFFVAHSFGGLIAKKVLVDASLKNNGPVTTLLKQTKGVVLFGTPSSGASNLQRLCASFLKESAPAVDYELDDQQLAQLDKSFSPFVKGRETTGWMDLLMFYETVPTEVDPYFKAVVVTEKQLPDFGRKIPTDQSHTELTRFQSKEKTYKEVLGLFEDVLREQRELKEAAKRRVSNAADTKFVTSRDNLPQIPKVEEKPSVPQNQPAEQENDPYKMLQPVIVEPKEGQVAAEDSSQSPDPEESTAAKSEYYGYQGCIGRDEAEKLLAGMDVGTFLVRWSDRARSYVISYVTQNRGMSHLADIHEQDDGTLLVTTKQGKVSYPTIQSFVQYLKEQGQLTQPVPETAN